MIDLDMIRRYGTAGLAVLFLVLWRVAERKESRALQIAATTVETTAHCVATYGQAANSIGAAVHDLTTALRAQ